MIKIFYNPDYQELIFSVVSILLNLEKKYLNESYYFVPMKVKDLNRNEYLVKKKLIDGTEDLTGIDYSDFFFDEGDPKYFLLGIYPESKEDEKEIFNFFDKHEKEIFLWVDWHAWPANLTDYMRERSDKIHLEADSTGLWILKKAGYKVFPDYLESERAMINIDMRNPLAARYSKVFLVNKSMGLIRGCQKVCAFLSFYLAVLEMACSEVNEGLDETEKLFLSMIKEADEIKKKFTDDEPVFQRAKKVGRPVGSIFMGNVDDYFFIEKVLEHGLKTYPWLCVIGFIFDGEYRLSIASNKIPVKELRKYYAPYVNDRDKMLKILSEEVLRK